jgi:hypothetical protein
MKARTIGAVVVAGAVGVGCVYILIAEMAGRTPVKDELTLERIPKKQVSSVVTAQSMGAGSPWNNGSALRQVGSLAAQSHYE